MCILLVLFLSSPILWWGEKRRSISGHSESYLWVSSRHKWWLVLWLFLILPFRCLCRWILAGNAQLKIRKEKFFAWFFSTSVSIDVNLSQHKVSKGFIFIYFPSLLHSPNLSLVWFCYDFRLNTRKNKSQIKKQYKFIINSLCKPLLIIQISFNLLSTNKSRRCLWNQVCVIISYYLLKYLQINGKNTASSGVCGLRYGVVSLQKECTKVV